MAPADACRERSSDWRGAVTSERNGSTGTSGCGSGRCLFAEEATFSAEVAGCQVECGAGSGMAAAALTAMMGGTIENCMDAASVGLQNITGLACDPVGNRVEWPCLGKNIMGGSNALASANMILAGYDKVIPLDETIGAIYEIGLSLPLELRCTFGGLGKTKTAREILKRSDAHFPGEGGAGRCNSKHRERTVTVCVRCVL